MDMMNVVPSLQVDHQKVATSETFSEIIFPSRALIARSRELSRVLQKQTLCHPPLLGALESLLEVT